MHVGSNPKFQCDFCNKCFRGKSVLVNHVKTVHDKIKNFKCDLCEQTFSQKHCLDRHKKMRCKNRGS